MRSGFYNLVASGLEPDPDMDLATWANKFYVLPKESAAEPGPYRSSRTPFVEEPLRELSAMSSTEVAILQKPTQLGGTTIATIFMLGTIDMIGGPMLAMLPTDVLARSFSHKKLMPAVRMVDRLREKFPEGSKNENNTILRKSGPGWSLTLTGSNSGASFRSESIRFLILDDFDGFSDNIGNEGSPQELADRRTGTFKNRKIFINSTVTTIGSPIDQAYQQSSQGRFCVPCPICGHYQYLTFGGIDADHGIRFERDDDGQVIDCFYQCECCHGRIDESEKPWMLENGAYIHQYPERKVRGFKYNMLVCPLGWVNDWRYVTIKFLEANEERKKGNYEKLIVWHNSMMAEPYEQKSERETSELVRLCDDRPDGIVPAGILGLTAGVDTQDNGFFYVVRSWSEGHTSHLVHCGFTDTFDGLEQIIFGSEYRDPSGNGYRIALALIDAMGHRTKEVYEYCRGRRGILPIKGERWMDMPQKTSKIDYFPNTTIQIPGGITLIRINSNYYKNALNNKLLVEPGEPGSFNLNSAVPDAYFRQMTSEYIGKSGYWECPKWKQNHFWDCEYLNMAAADYCRFLFQPKAGTPPPQTRPQPPGSRPPGGGIKGFRRPSWLDR